MANITLKGAGLTNAASATEYTKTFDCAVSVSIGDVVYPSDATDNLVITNTDNTKLSPSIGVVIAKPTTTTCTVQMFGECSLTFTGIQRSKKVFLDTDGTLTTSVPGTGYLQQMGFSYENTKVFIDPQEIRVKLNP